MSDAAIDRSYEEDLQAAARYLEVWVTYKSGKRRKVRTFLDVPGSVGENAGRVVAAKAADQWYELDAVERVEVVPVGAVSPREAGHGGGRAPSRTPAPIRATCEVGSRLCRLETYAGPSGKRVRHGWSCPDRPGEPISLKEYAKGREWPPVAS
jgi:hypothetical protein